ncbi:MAG: hypothetical protein ACFFDI_05155, partial [Promethearchaeota archaeon]
MNYWGLIPLLSCCAFTVLCILVLSQAKRWVERVFGLFLFASAIWSFTSFMLVYNPNAPFQYLRLWNGLVLTVMPWVGVSYYHFVRAYNNKPAGILLYIYYVAIIAILIANLKGVMVKSAAIIDGFVYHNIKPWDYVIAGLLVVSLVSVFYMLVRRYRESADSADRNRTMY